MTGRRVLDLIGHAHLDLVWLWPWQEAYQEARATFRSALDRMDEDPDFVFTCDQVVLLEWVEEQDPALFERIRSRVAEGRWVNVGGWWVEPDCNLPSGEAFARQGLLGQRFLIDRFGAPATIGMNVDPFGHHGMLPQILRLQGMTGYVFQRPGPHEKTMPGGSLFRWRSSDGSEVLAYRIPFEYQNSRETLERQVEKAIGQLDTALPEAMVFYGVGNHGGGPTRTHLRSIHRLQELGTFGELRMSDPVSYFRSVEQRIADGEFAPPLVEGDLQHHAPGCYSAHSGIKLWQRRAQSALLVAERWAVAAAVRFGAPVTAADLSRAWRAVLLNQFHDILPGSAIEEAYDDARDQLGEAVSIAHRITVRAHTEFARRILLPLDDETQPVVVFNHHPWPVNADVELTVAVGFEADPDHVSDEDGSPVASQAMRPRALFGRTSGLVFRAELPPFGWRTYRLHRSGGARPPRPETRELVLENASVLVEFDPRTGWFRRLVHKSSGIDLAGAAQAPHAVVSSDSSDTWGHRVVTYAGDGDEMAVARIHLNEDGPVRQSVVVERRWGSSTLVEEFLLGAHDSGVEVRAMLDWREQRRLLKLRIPVSVESPEATSEIPFGSIARPVDGAEQPGQTWADLSGSTPGGVGGVSVLVAGKHGFDFSPGGVPSIGVTAVRSPVYAWHDPAELAEDETYRYQDQGPQRFAYRIVPHAGAAPVADLHRASAEFLIPPRAMLESFHEGELEPSGSLAAIEESAVSVTAIKPGEDHDDGHETIIVRAVETGGVGGPAHIAVPLVGAVIEADLRPHEIRTWRITATVPPRIVPVDLIERPVGQSHDR